MHLASSLAISRFLFLEDALQRVDLLVVLGNRMPETMTLPIQLYSQGFAPRILVTGHGPRKDMKNECEMFCQYAIERGLPERVLIREAQATNTLENFLFSAPIVDEQIGWSNVRVVGVVCLSFHTRRVLMTARRHWPDHLKYLFFPVVDKRGIRADNWWTSEAGRHRVLAELRRIGEYAERGDIEID